MTARRKKDNPKTEKKKRKICVFVFKKSKVYVDKTSADDLWRYYDNHYRERITMTKELFAEAKSCNQLPAFFLLEEIFGTDADAFSRCIAWSKHFLLSGYQLLGDKMTTLVDEIDEETDLIYDSIKTISIEEICDCSRNLFPEFKKVGKPKRTKESRLEPDTHRIQFLVKDDEYLKYKRTAEQYGVPMAEYILDCVRLGGVFQVDTSFMEQYIRQLDNCYNIFSGMLATILISKEYYPSDIEMMDEISKKILVSNEAVKAEIIRLCRQLRRMKEGEQLNSDQLL